MIDKVSVDSESQGDGFKRGRPFVLPMSQGLQAQFYKTKAWQECRDKYFRSVGGLCERCKARGLIVPAEIVHHKVHLNENNINDPSVTLNPNNLEALCAKCHGEEHSKIRRRYVIEDDGSVITR